MQLATHLSSDGLCKGRPSASPPPRYHVIHFTPSSHTQLQDACYQYLHVRQLILGPVGEQSPVGDQVGNNFFADVYPLFGEWDACRAQHASHEHRGSQQTMESAVCCLNKLQTTNNGACNGARAGTQGLRMRLTTCPCTAAGPLGCCLQLSGRPPSNPWFPQPRTLHYPLSPASLQPPSCRA